MNSTSRWIVLLAVVVACGSDRAPAHHDSKRATAVSTSAAATPAHGPEGDDSLDETRPRPGYGLPHPGSWTPTKTYDGARYTFTYPASATLEDRKSRGAPGPELSISELPECKWPCYIEVSVWRDSTGKGLNGQLREWMTADTTGGNSDAADYLPTVLDSIPLGGEPAVQLENFCGDCTNHGVYTASGGWIAGIDYILDDREGDNPALMAKLEAIARTFRWRH